jgi:hypothetical protein
MNLKLRLLLIAVGIIVVIASAIGFVSQNFNLGGQSSQEIYANNFATKLLLAAAVAGISSIIAATRIKKISGLGVIAFLGLLAINNPWAYDGINVGFIENPWFNPALILLIMVSAVISILAIITAFKPKKL